MAKAFLKSIKEHSSTILIFFILFSVLFRIAGFSFISELVLWGIYTLFAVLFITFFIQANSETLKIQGKMVIIIIPFLPLFKFMDAFLIKSLMSLCIIIIFLISSNRILWLNKKNWQYSFLIIFLYIISIVFSFVSLKYAGNTSLKVIDEMASPNEKHRLVTKREVSGSAVGNTYVYLDKYYLNLIKKSTIKHRSSWTGIPVLTWVNDKEFKIDHKVFSIK